MRGRVSWRGKNACMCVYVRIHVHVTVLRSLIPPGFLIRHARVPTVLREDAQQKAPQCCGKGTSLGGCGLWAWFHGRTPRPRSSASTSP